MTQHARSDQRIARLHPDLAQAAAELVRRCDSEHGIRLVVTQGLRTVAEQDALYAQGRTAPGRVVTQARGGYSWHNYGLAFDVAPLNDQGQPHWPEDAALWERIGATGEDLGLTWGGRWRQHPDRPHFELTFGLALSALRAGLVQVPGADPTRARA